MDEKKALTVEPETSIIKSKVMGWITFIITATLCALLVVYIAFSMYHKTPLGDDELKVFTGIAYGLNNILVMWFTSEIVQQKN